MRAEEFIVWRGCLLLLLAIVIVTTASCQMVTESQKQAQVKAREDTLQSALKYLREAIRDYTHDHGKPPQRLDDLLTAGYFASLPIDPITGKADWSVEFIPCTGSAPCEQLIKDVHSSSTDRSSKNNRYSEW